MEEKRKGYATSEANVAAQKRWVEANPERKKLKTIYAKKSNARSFIRDHAGYDELMELLGMIKERLKEFE